MPGLALGGVPESFERRLPLHMRGDRKKRIWNSVRMRRIAWKQPGAAFASAHSVILPGHIASCIRLAASPMLGNCSGQLGTYILASRYDRRSNIGAIVVRMIERENCRIHGGFGNSGSRIGLSSCVKLHGEKFGQ